MSNAIIMNLAAIAVIVAGWTAAVALFYSRLNDSPAQRHATRGHEVVEFPGAATRPQPVLAVERAA